MHKPAARTIWRAAFLERLALAGLVMLSAAHPAGAATTNIYTIGTRTANVDISSVSGSGPWTVQLAASTDLSNVALNDKLLDEANPQKAWKITAINDGADTVTVVDSESNGGSPANAGGQQATISRWYITMQAWETARQGNLVTRDAIEKGELYKDSTFSGSALIDGSTTDATRYLWLTVPSSQRHNGTAGTGVKIDLGGGDAFGFVIRVSDPYTRIEGLEIANYTSNAQSSAGISVLDTTNVLIDGVLIHDWTRGAQPDFGIHIYDTGPGASGTVRNSIIYDGTDSGIYAYTTATVNVYNTTIYNVANEGLHRSAGTVVARNTICMNNGTDFSGTLTQSYNMSSDATASGTGSLTSKTASTQFVSLTGGSENFHLKIGADARGAGTDLSGSGVTADIDGDLRPQEGSWDMGADEYLDKLRLEGVRLEGLRLE